MVWISEWVGVAVGVYGESTVYSAPKPGKKWPVICPGAKSRVGGRDRTVNLDCLQNLATIFDKLLHLLGCQTGNFPPRAREEWGIICFARHQEIYRPVGVYRNRPSRAKRQNLGPSKRPEALF